jgi:hypothetical protein
MNYSQYFFVFPSAWPGMKHSRQKRRTGQAMGSTHRHLSPQHKKAAFLLCQGGRRLYACRSALPVRLG